MTVWTACDQLGTYKAERPALPKHSAVLVVSDVLDARIGSLTANQEWFEVAGRLTAKAMQPRTALELETLWRGVFEPRRLP